MSSSDMPDALEQPRPSIRDEIRQIDALPANQGEIGIVAKDGAAGPVDVGVAGSFQHQVGKRWSIGAAGQWMKNAGWSIAAKVGFKR